MSDIVVCKYCKFFKPRKGTSKGKCTSDSSGNKDENERYHRIEE